VEQVMPKLMREGEVFTARTLDAVVIKNTPFIIVFGAWKQRAFEVLRCLDSFKSCNGRVWKGMLGKFVSYVGDLYRKSLDPMRCSKGIQKLRQMDGPLLRRGWKLHFFLPHRSMVS